MSRTRTSAFLLGLAATAAAQAPAVDPSCYGPAISPGVVCPGERVDPAAAIDAPSTYAWDVFGELNEPAFPGHPTDTRRVWETWKNADENSDPNEAIYLDDGHAPRPWNVAPVDSLPEKALVPIQQLQMLDALSARDDGPGALFLPESPLAEEVRVNRPAFNFILENELYNQQGQYRYASTHPAFDFPTASKEVKAVWVEVESDMDPADYYTAQAEGKTYALVAMHVITKDIPFWFWSTFVHVDQNKDPTSGYVAPLATDQSGEQRFAGTPFANYRLLGILEQGAGGRLTNSGAGAQLDWITRTGEPTVVGNPHIEKGFEKRSSCITCHARASIGLTAQGTVSYNSFSLDVGAVDPGAFHQDGVTFYPLDFLWSLRQAKPYRP